MTALVMWLALGIWFWLTVGAAMLGRKWMRASFSRQKMGGRGRGVGQFYAADGRLVGVLGH